MKKKCENCIHSSCNCLDDFACCLMCGDTDLLFVPKAHFSITRFLIKYVK